MFGVWRLWKRLGGWKGTLAQGLLAWRLLLDRRVPIYPKLVFPLALVYFFSPINLPLQFIPFIGQVDDIGIALLATGVFLKLCPKELVQEHARRLEEEMSGSHRFSRTPKIIRPSFKRWTAGQAPNSGR